jgi:hypothetical protein
MVDDQNWKRREAGDVKSQKVKRERSEYDVIRSQHSVLSPQHSLLST